MFYPRLSKTLERFGGQEVFHKAKNMLCRQIIRIETEGKSVLVYTTSKSSHFSIIPLGLINTNI